jgi:hypothetical protein
LVDKKLAKETKLKRRKNSIGKNVHYKMNAKRFKKREEIEN